jgi:transposase
MSTMVGERLQQPQNIDAYAQSLSVQDLADRGTGSPVPSDDRMLQARLHPLVQSVMDLHKAFKNFFEGRAGFPKFRRKGETDAPLISISQLTKLRTCQ